MTMAASIGWDGAIEAVRRAATAAVNAQADLAQERTRKFAPDDPATGGDDLRASIFVEHATPGDLTAQVGTDSPYAKYQHEALYLEHPNRGQAKYMESAVIGGNSRNVLLDAAVAAFQRALP